MDLIIDGFVERMRKFLEEFVLEIEKQEEEI